MKYIIIESGNAKPVVVMFSPEVAHIDVAKLFVGRVIGAGFVTVENPQPHVAGFSTSLGLGANQMDATIIAYDFHQTSRQYPAPPVVTTAETYPWAEGFLALSPEERAAFMATAAPVRCTSCGDFVKDAPQHGQPVVRDHCFCPTCAALFRERTARAHTS
jgi:hypothetical protein